MIDSEGGVYLVGDIFGVRHEDIDTEVLETLETVLNTLSQQEQTVLELRYGLRDGSCRTLDEVGSALGHVTRERIRQIQEKSLRKLRHPSRSRHLKPFVKPNAEKASEPFTSPYWRQLKARKPQKHFRVTLVQKVISTFENRFGYADGLDIHQLTIRLLGYDTPASRRSVKQAIYAVKWYFLLSKNLVLASVRGPEGYRYCIVASAEEAMLAQGLYTRHAAGNLKRLLVNEPALAEAGLIPEPLDRRLMSLGPFVNLLKALPPRTENKNN